MLVKLSNNMYISTSKIRSIQDWIDYNFEMDGNGRRGLDPIERVIGSIIYYETGQTINVKDLNPEQVYEAVKDDL